MVVAAETTFLLGIGESGRTSGLNRLGVGLDLVSTPSIIVLFRLGNGVLDETTLIFVSGDILGNRGIESTGNITSILLIGTSDFDSSPLVILRLFCGGSESGFIIEVRSNNFSIFFNDSPASS